MLFLSNFYIFTWGYFYNIYIYITFLTFSVKTLLNKNVDFDLRNIAYSFNFYNEILFLKLNWT